MCILLDDRSFFFLKDGSSNDTVDHLFDGSDSLFTDSVGIPSTHRLHLGLSWQPPDAPAPSSNPSNIDSIIRYENAAVLLFIFISFSSRLPAVPVEHCCAAHDVV